MSNLQRKKGLVILTICFPQSCNCWNGFMGRD